MDSHPIVTGWTVRDAVHTAYNPRRLISLPSVFKPPATATQHFIAVQMPESVVDLLESVQIHHQHRQGLVVAFSARNLRIQSQEERARIGQVGQKIGGGRRFHLAEAQRVSMDIPILALIPSRMRKWSLVKASRST